jgi:hypothetical protein
MTELLSNDLGTICQALQSKLEASMSNLGLNAVYYGDQDSIPTTPIACVEPDMKKQIFLAAQYMFQGEVTVFILVYSSYVTSPQTNRLEADEVATAIEDLLHQDLQLGGLVVAGWVTEIQSGYAKKKNSIVRCSRITWSAKTRKQIQPS